MEYIILSILIVLTLVTLKLIMGISLKKLKEFSLKNEELDCLTSNLPEDQEICRQILKTVGNENVNVVKNNDEKSSTSLYLVLNNTISIADMKGKHTRVQTIAHECIHSIQNKKILWLNFIFSNIYLIYFIAITLLTLFKIIQNIEVYMSILIFLGLIQYAIRSFLEIDAMTRAKYLAKDYLQNTNFYNKEEIDILTSSYDEINKQSIPFVVWYLLTNVCIPVIIYSIVSLITNFLF